MAHTTTLSLCEHIDAETMLRVASAMRDSALYREPRFLDGPDDNGENEWESLFQHHDPRSLGWGYFCHDETERESRRLDMRGPNDFDPGPLAMGEGHDNSGAIVLRFARSQEDRTPRERYRHHTPKKKTPKSKSNSP